MTLTVNSTISSILDDTILTVWLSTTWTSSNSSVVSITSKGKKTCTIRANAEGTARIQGDVFWSSVAAASHTIDYWDIKVEGGVITITASPSGGTVSKGTKVTLSTNPSGSNIYYTLDGSTPNSYSKSYSSSGITIDKDCTLKAIAMKSGYTTSNILTAKYTVTPSIGDSFTAKTAEGVNMKFEIIDATAKTCKVAKLAIDQKTSGKITIPSSINGYKVTSVEDRAFASCSNLTSIEIPNTVTSIGDGAFMHCSGLTSINIPNSVTNMGNSVFYGCSGFTSINIPNSVTKIGEGAFESCM